MRIQSNIHTNFNLDKKNVTIKEKRFVDILFFVTYFVTLVTKLKIMVCLLSSYTNKAK
jgi:hypothetical protein